MGANWAPLEKKITGKGVVMYVRRRGKLWQCYVRYKGGRQVKSFDSKGSATQWGIRTLAEMQEGSYKNRDSLYKMQLRDLLDLYYDHAKDNYRSSTAMHTINYLKNQSIGKVYLAQLDGVRLSQFKKIELGKKKSPSTVRKYLLLISKAINVSINELDIPLTSNPVNQVSLPKDPAHRDRVLSSDERHRLLEACNESTYNMTAIVELALETIMRRGELFNLKYEDCDLQIGTAWVRLTKSGKPRRIGLSTKACEIIKKLPRSVDGKLFAIQSVSSFEKSFRRAVANASIKDFHFHDLRHTGATHLAEQGWTLVELMAQGGWSSADMVQRYANISANHLAKRLRK